MDTLLNEIKQTAVAVLDTVQAVLAGIVKSPILITLLIIGVVAKGFEGKALKIGKILNLKI